MQEVLDLMLPADTRSVSTARHLVREAMGASVVADRADDAALAVSELATNAVVHVGAAFLLRMVTSPSGVRVELRDPSTQLPTARNFSHTAGTGRGLRIVEESVDRWGVDPGPRGKTVWFEVGTLLQERLPDPRPEEGPDVRRGPSVVEVVLLDVPLLMHMAWQEHAQALLREYLLYRIADDEHVLEQHAATSEALAFLYEHIPQPQLPDDPDALLAETLEADVTARELRLAVPTSLVDNFSTLSLLIGRAVEAARAGHFLGPPTQPEIEDMREWLCQEVMRQAAGHADPSPWRTLTDVRTRLADPADLTQRYAALLDELDHVIVADAASVIVAVSDSVAAFLGYDRPDDLVGRRIIVVVPDRYHQAHIAGTTLNATNGRDKLLGVRIAVPILRADGTEIPVELTVTPRHLDHARVFIGFLSLPER